MKPGKRWLPAHLLVWTYAVLLIVPLYYFLASAFKSNEEIFAHPFALPTSFGFDNFRTAYRGADLGPAVVNSALVTVLALVLTLLLALPAAFALARSAGRLASAMEKVFSLGFLVPTFAALFPTFLLAAATGLFHTRAFMVIFLPATAMPLSVVILVQFMRTIPREMEEAARMDGASTYAVLRHIYTPMCLPGIATVLLLNFLTFWNEYLYSLVIIGPDPEQRTVQVALPTLKAITGTDYGVLTAGTVLTLVPVWVVYTVLQKRMQEALVNGAVKM
ncbi:MULTISPECIES: carbohydrate ABC transporter permease [Streptomyces]|uniref:Multiple sugar transport system permease protein n=2 Tax=Streptomyces TaxID=1883 RepID=A0ABT9L2F2_9ACTN|nr:MULTISPECIES: carbohydrate ABC transporter permease [Streptomyces]MBW8089835.1 carbohydrate ABC transporter permease [Streptomyces hygroscopicus subsp. hygroscopicus]MCO8306771.1 carbohydrate ABC transporter permease [Streptomyces sp. RKCA744]MDN3057886.1 carbohydrate ABC transporter permease [Streptomyces sp. SRF1]MDP9614881.1 multiple sugar transport system permease protein [Streptomyces demainii]GHJ32765.1 transporter [Streptomyces hygroscopicus]